MAFSKCFKKYGNDGNHDYIDGGRDNDWYVNDTISSFHFDVIQLIFLIRANGGCLKVTTCQTWVTLCSLRTDKFFFISENNQLSFIYMHGIKVLYNNDGKNSWQKGGTSPTLRQLIVKYCSDHDDLNIPLIMVSSDDCDNGGDSFLTSRSQWLW